MLFEWKNRMEVLLITLCVVTVSFGMYNNYFNEADKKPIAESVLAEHQNIVDEFYNKRRSWHLSNLGSFLFQNTGKKFKEENREYIVLVWKFWNWLRVRHLQGHKGRDPLDDCSVQNCRFIGHDKVIQDVDAVVVHIQSGVFPSIRYKNPKQLWIFLNDEPPHFAFSMAQRQVRMAEIANMFNWSMTYRSDSEIPIPYGRTVPLSKPILPIMSHETLGELIPYWNMKSKNVLVASLMSNCASFRMQFIKQLQKELKVDVFGKCSTNKALMHVCPGHFTADCHVINKYLFYLALENSKCRHYFSEKIFHNAYLKGAIPIVMGPPISDCEKILPPNSYLHVDNYASVSELANHIKQISTDEKEYLKYHSWRNHFAVKDESGYLGGRSMQLCRICEGLNYNSKEPTIYDINEIKLHLDQNLLCK